MAALLSIYSSASQAMNSGGDVRVKEEGKFLT